MNERGDGTPDEAVGENPGRPRKRRLIAGFAPGAALIVLVAMAADLAEDARRKATCRERLLQVSLGLHDDHDAFGSLLHAAHPDDRLPPEERSSRQLLIIPQMFCSHCRGLDGIGECDPICTFRDS